MSDKRTGKKAKKLPVPKVPPGTIGAATDPVTVGPLRGSPPRTSK